MRVVIEFDNFETAEDFVETCMANGAIIGDNGYDFDFRGYEFTNNGEIILDVSVLEYSQDDFGDFENDE